MRFWLHYFPESCRLGIGNGLLFYRKRGCWNVVVENKKARLLILSNLAFVKVIPAGFEPTTHSLEGCCSIQLSYETILCFAGAKIVIEFCFS